MSLKHHVVPENEKYTQKKTNAPLTDAKRVQGPNETVPNGQSPSNLNDTINKIVLDYNPKCKTKQKANQYNSIHQQGRKTLLSFQYVQNRHLTKFNIHL